MLKVELDVKGPRKTPGKKWGWGFMTYYEDLPEEYVTEITNVAESFAAFIINTPGTATEEPKYVAEFEVTGPEVKKPIHATQRDLKYSEMYNMQQAGLKALANLNQSAEMEIKAGQRK